MQRLFHWYACLAFNVYCISIRQAIPWPRCRCSSCCSCCSCCSTLSTNCSGPNLWHFASGQTDKASTQLAKKDSTAKRVHKTFKAFQGGNMKGVERKVYIREGRQREGWGRHVCARACVPWPLPCLHSAIGCLCPICCCSTPVSTLFLPLFLLPSLSLPSSLPSFLSPLPLCLLPLPLLALSKSTWA